MEVRGVIAPAYWWSLRRILSRVGKPWSRMESNLTVNSPPSSYIVVQIESRMLLVFYVSTVAAGAAFGTQEHKPGHQKRWNISCKDRCLRRPVEVFTRPRRGNGKEEAFASLSRANLGRHRQINYHVLMMFFIDVLTKKLVISDNGEPFQGKYQWIKARI